MLADAPARAARGRSERGSHARGVERRAPEGRRAVVNEPASDGPRSPTGVLTPARFDAVLFDLDGVLTSTARIHAAAWKQMFDDYLGARSRRTAEPFRPFDLRADYKQYVDGKPRYDGVRSFLASRGIALPEGSPASPPEEASVCGLGNRKDELVRQAIHGGRVHAYPGATTLAGWLRRRGLKMAVVSSSHNCAEILRAAGIEDLFQVRVDGEVIDRLRLRGKPAPDTYLHAAERLGVAPARAVVVEDALAGVQAGRAGAFGLVVGVDRGGSAELLRNNGADLVVSDLGELLGEHAG
jgi:beta-phosphoglucomutase family hydrolase